MVKIMKKIPALTCCILILSCAGSKVLQEIPPADINESTVLPSGFPEEDKAANNTAEDRVSLDSALTDFSVYIAERLPASALAAIASIDAPVQRLGNYAADRLNDLLLNTGGIRLVGRQDYERIISEQNLQTSLFFNDDTTAKIGHTLGWSTIVYGAVEPLQNAYHLSLRAVDVETGEIQGSKTYLLDSGDPILINLINPEIAVQRLYERKSLLAYFDGIQNDFEISLSTDKTVFYDGDFLFITLESDTDCYFVMYHLDIDNNMRLIFPNIWEPDTNYLLADTPRTIPENSFFLLHEPYGEERILVYATDHKIEIDEDQYRAITITKENLSDPEALWQGGTPEPETEPRNATGQIVYTILPK